MIGLELLYSANSQRLKSKDDALFLVIHCFLINDGYRCLGNGTESSSGDKESEQLPNGWNTNSGSYTLRYTKKDKSGKEEKKLLVKVLRVDAHSLVNVLLTPGDLTATADLPIDTYITNNYSDYNSAFVDQTSTEKLKEALQKMMNDLKPSQNPEPKKSNPKNEEQRHDPLMEPRQNYPPMAGSRSGLPGRNPYLPSLGGADLDPLQRGVGGGMIMGPNDFPTYNQPRRGRDPFDLPPGAVPPGARFDPFGPPMPGRPGRGPAPGTGRFSNPDPDNVYRRRDDYDDMFM